MRRCARSARASACRCRATRRCGRRSPRSPSTPGPTRWTCPAPRSPRRPTRRKGWKHEPLRPIVRRVAFSATEIAKLRGSRRLNTIHPAQLALALDGQLEQVYGYGFIVTDIPHQPTAWVEHFHRHRAQIEERLKEAKLGQALRHLPSGDEHANRVWLTCALLALNLTAFCCDLCPAAAASGKAPDDAPLRRAAHTLRRILFNIPARIVRSARRTILRLPAGFRHADAFQATLDAVYALPPP